MTHPLYQNTKFPQYVFEEYPKMVYVTDMDYPHNGKVVNNPEEELAILGYLMKDRYPKAETPSASRQLQAREDGERNFLVGILATMNAQFDENAPIEDLRAALQGFAQPPAAAAALPAPDDAVKPVAPVQPEPIDPGFLNGEKSQGDAAHAAA